MNFRLTQEHEIAEVRVRRTWTGKLCVQIRRKVRRALWGLPTDREVKWEDAGLGSWRDASGNEASEVAEVVMKLRTLNFEPLKENQK